VVRKATLDCPASSSCQVNLTVPANKLLVEVRLKGAGMHWAPTSINPMVALRTVAYGDPWETAWPLIRTAQRHERQAASRQRRTIRLAERARLAAERATQARLAVAVPTPAPTEPAPSTPPPPKAAPAHRRTSNPAPNHPWRTGTLSHRRSASRKILAATLWQEKPPCAPASSTPYVRVTIPLTMFDDWVPDHVSLIAVAWAPRPLGSRSLRAAA
jgi:hypothetical protein